MKIRELLEALSSLPLTARDQDILIDCGEEEYYDMEVVPIDDGGTIGYVFTRVVHYKDPHQLMLPFEA